MKLKDHDEGKRNISFRLKPMSSEAETIGNGVAHLPHIPPQTLPREREDSGPPTSVDATISLSEVHDRKWQ